MYTKFALLEGFIPVSFRIDTRHGVVPCRSWGTITDAELVSYGRALRDDPRFDPAFRQIVDLRGVESFNLTISGVRELASLNPFAVTARRSVIVGSDVAFGMVRMYQSCLATAENLLVCRDEREAAEWIGVDRTHLWPAAGDWIIMAALPSASTRYERTSAERAIASQG